MDERTARCTRDHEALKRDPVAFAALEQIGTQPTYDDPGQPDTLILANCTCGSTLAREVFSIPAEPLSAASLLPSAKPIVEDIDWLSRDEAIVTWQFAEGPPISTLVIVEFDEQFIADGDAPQAVLDKVEDEAADLADVDDDYDRDDGPGYADERHYGGDL